MASGTSKPVLQRALVVLVKRSLRPLVKIALIFGMSCLEFEDVTRWVFVDVALQEPEFALPSRNKQFKSRAAILTGLSRKEVMRLSKATPPGESGDIPCRNRAARVVTGWFVPPYADSKGNPRVLSIRSGQDSFTSLVRHYSGDIPYRAIFDELVVRGVIEKLDGGRVRLKAPGRLYQRASQDLMQSASDSLTEMLGGLEKQLRNNGKG